jgi:hypothetical protein
MTLLWRYGSCCRVEDSSKSAGGNAFNAIKMIRRSAEAPSAKSWLPESLSPQGVEAVLFLEVRESVVLVLTN